MKIIHTVASLGKQTGGGVSSSVYNLLCALYRQGIDVTAYTPNYGDETYGQDSFIHFTKNDLLFQPLAYSHSLRKSISNANGDCFHTHALWQDFTPYVIKTAQRKRKPCVVSLHGSFMQSALVNCGMMKRIWWNYVLHPAIVKATCIHATSEQEYEDFRLLGYKNPVAIIPNVFRAPHDASLYKKRDNKFRVGYLGRLHPHKQIELLIEAWKQLPYNDGELVLIGQGDDTYTSFLKNLAASHSAGNIRFMGFKEGDEKYEAIAQCDLMCLPSKSENFGMVVPETLSVGVPVWASTGTPWQALQEHNCGWWSDATIDNIKEVIISCKHRENDGVYEMANKARSFVQSAYSPYTVANQMIQMYEWVLHKGKKPHFIHL